MINEKIVIIGASGFIGASVLEFLYEKGFQVTGLGRQENPWRLTQKLKENYIVVDENNLIEHINVKKPKIIINFAASGAYSFQNDFQKMVNSNIILPEQIAKWAIQNNAWIIHGGTSSEYGTNSSAPSEESKVKPNSPYAITKLAATQILQYYSNFGLRSAVLRLYSVYGPKEDPSRLMPAVMRGIIKKEWPNFVESNISRDFIYLNDLNTFIYELLHLFFIKGLNQFEIFNVGSGRSTTIGELKNILELDYKMPVNNEINFPRREWDLENWYANIDKVKNIFKWRPKYDLKEGIMEMSNWYMINDNVKYLNIKYSENKLNG